MWNNVTEYVGTSRGLKDLNSAYYKLIQNETPVVFKNLESGNKDESQKSDNSKGNQEFLTGFHGSLLTESDYPLPYRTPSSSSAQELTGSGTHPRSRHHPHRLKSKTTYTKFPTGGSYSNLLASSLRMFDARNGSRIGLNVSIVDEEDNQSPVIGIDRCQSQIYPTNYSKVHERDLSIGTQSDHTQINSKKNKSLNPEPSFTKSVFDVEEDSQFQFYLEDLDSNYNIIKKSSEVKLPGSVKMTRDSPIQTSIKRNTITNIDEPTSSDSDESFATPSSQSASSLNKIQVQIQPEVDKAESTQFESVYSNPRYGERYACKNDEIILSVSKPLMNREKKLKRMNSSNLKLKVKSISSTEKFHRELIERRSKLKPVKIGGIRKMKSVEYVKSEFVPEIETHTTITSGGNADSTEFIFPPVLSESDISLHEHPSVNSYIITGENISKEFLKEDSSTEHETPDPDMEAIREYNHRLNTGSSNIEFQNQTAEQSRPIIRTISKASSIVGNIPSDSWMMLPLRLLPGSLVPYCLLIFIPFILMILLSVGYLVVVKFKF